MTLFPSVSTNYQSSICLYCLINTHRICLIFFISILPTLQALSSNQAVASILLSLSKLFPLIFWHVLLNMTSSISIPFSFLHSLLSTSWSCLYTLLHLISSLPSTQLSVTLNFLLIPRFLMLGLCTYLGPDISSPLSSSFPQPPWSFKDKVVPTPGNFSDPSSASPLQDWIRYSFHTSMIVVITF